MENTQLVQLNLSAPNLVNICIDETRDGELCGKFYHCYTDQAESFSSVVELIRKIDSLFDAISFPQASTKSRSFSKKPETKAASQKQKLVDQREIVQHTGTLGTFILFVKFRQNSTWQGEIHWIEGDAKKYFSNTLDLIKLMDRSINQSAN